MSGIFLPTIGRQLRANRANCVSIMPGRLPPKKGTPALGMLADQMYYGFALVTLTLFLTLPQAILLWTEPDLEQVRSSE